MQLFLNYALEIPIKLIAEFLTKIFCANPRKIMVEILTKLLYFKTSFKNIMPEILTKNNARKNSQSRYFCA